MFRRINGVDHRTLKTSTQGVRSLSFQKGLRILLPVLLLATVFGCGSSSQQTDASFDATLRPRSFAMGWSPWAPKPTAESTFATATAMARVSEFALVQQPVLWKRIFAGETVSSLVNEQADFAAFLRNLGLEIVWLVDPLNGLNRTLETPELVAAGRSILEPEIRSLHEQWVLEVARRIQPQYLGLASEINTLGAHGDPALYAELVDLANTLAAQIHIINPEIQVFVSFQVEDAWQLPPFPFSSVDHFQLIDDFDIDALGLSSYPVFSFNSPADIPSDYFARFATATDLPLILVEGGWSSVTKPVVQGSPQEQADFFSRFEQLLDSVQAELWVMLFFADFDEGAYVAAWGLPPEQESLLAVFSSMGIVDQTLTPKLSYAVWERIVSRPHR